MNQNLRNELKSIAEKLDGNIIAEFFLGLYIVSATINSPPSYPSLRKNNTYENTKNYTRDNCWGCSRPCYFFHSFSEILCWGIFK